MPLASENPLGLSCTPMRTLSAALCLVMLLALTLARPSTLIAQTMALGQNSVSPEELEESGGLVRKTGEKAPYTGLVQDYHRSGSLRLEARYDAGKLVVSKVWYENGQLAEEVTVASDTWTIQRYGETGKLEERTVAHFAGGRKVSEQTRLWDENGQLRTEAGFELGKLQGPLKEFDASGEVVRDELYEKGKLVKKNK